MIGKYLIGILFFLSLIKTSYTLKCISSISFRNNITTKTVECEPNEDRCLASSWDFGKDINLVLASCTNKVFCSFIKNDQLNDELKEIFRVLMHSYMKTIRDQAINIGTSTGIKIHEHFLDVTSTPEKFEKTKIRLKCCNDGDNCNLNYLWS
uniref:Saposin B-type domain-containing protein n=1 Tax=Parastrongyloides trichosuri TaxID=131310 RepID=A0A0N4ZKX4_PARTI